jgi:uncharacterized membrane protein YkoI
MVVSSLRADEEKVALKDVPKAVLKAVKDKFPKAKVTGAEKEKEDGKTVFEIQIKEGDQKIEVVVTPEGKIVAIEKEIKKSDVPRAVAEALEKKYPKASIKKIEEVTKGDKVAYEFLIEVDKKKLEATFDSKGKFLEEEKKQKKEKE